MNNQPLFSVLIANYNNGKYLMDAIESVRQQTYTHWEIILVDDGSPDNCPAICDEWEKKDSRIKVIHKPNGGVSSARNKGLDIATGEYVQFVDSDDCLEQNYCNTLVSAYDKDVDFVISDEDMELLKNVEKIDNYGDSSFFPVFGGKL